MATTWKATPVFSQRSITELHDAIYLVGGSPAVWTDGTELPPNTTLRAVHLTEVLDAIQRLWNDRDLGLIPNWTGQADPSSPRESHITDLRKWFNHWESWGDLRGVHWWKDTTVAGNTLSVFPKVGWNVESVIALTTEPNDQNETFYDESHVNQVHGHCEAARNYGLVNIVRLDWKKGHAVPKADEGYDTWTERFTSAVNTLKDVATLFIVGNEPNKETNITSSEYAAAFNHLYGNRVADTKYLAAGPAAWHATDYAGPASESDIVWLRNVSNAINEGQLDGWALHTYGSPYLDYAGETDASDVLCNIPDVDCPIDRDIHKDSRLEGDADFRRYQDYIDEIKGKWAQKPVYITETNTYGYKHDHEPDDGTPAHTYLTGWNQSAYREIRNFNTEKNANRSEWPQVLCLCWFVDSYRGNTAWMEFALSNEDEEKLVQARADFKASDTSTGILPGNPTSNLAPWVPILEHTTGTRILSGTIS